MSHAHIQYTHTAYPYNYSLNYLQCVTKLAAAHDTTGQLEPSTSPMIHVCNIHGDYYHKYVYSIQSILHFMNV